MSGVVCHKCWNSTNDATVPRCGKDDCPGKPKPFLSGIPLYPGIKGEQG